MRELIFFVRRRSLSRRRWPYVGIIGPGAARFMLLVELADNSNQDENERWEQRAAENPSWTGVAAAAGSEHAICLYLSGSPNFARPLLAILNSNVNFRSIYSSLASSISYCEIIRQF